MSKKFEIIGVSQVGRTVSRAYVDGAVEARSKMKVMLDIGDVSVTHASALNNPYILSRDDVGWYDDGNDNLTENEAIEILEEFL